MDLVDSAVGADLAAEDDARRDSRRRVVDLDQERGEPVEDSYGEALRRYFLHEAEVQPGDARASDYDAERGSIVSASIVDRDRPRAQQCLDLSEVPARERKREALERGARLLLQSAGRRSTRGVVGVHRGARAMV